MPSELFKGLTILATLPFESMDRIPSPVVYLMGCRSFDQFCCTFRSLLDPERFCPFCKRELERRGRKPAARAERWMLIENEFPNPDVSQMWLVVPSEHHTGLHQLGGPDWVEIGQLLTQCTREFGIAGGGVVFRFGDPLLHVGTIPHLHLNIIEPFPGQEFRTPLAKTLEKHAKDYARLVEHFQQLVEAGGEEWLISLEGIKKTQPESV